MRFLSQVYTIARGSVGGITYSANQFHQLIARARTSPVQPGTPYQAGIRSAFSLADDVWRLLVPADREAWNLYSQTCLYTGPLGDYTVPGRSLMIGSHGLASYSHYFQPLLFDVTSAPPTIAGWFNPGSVEVIPYTGPLQGIALSVTLETGRSAIAVVDVSLAYELSRDRFKGPWISSSKTVGICLAGAVTSIKIVRPVSTIGKAVFSRLRLFTASKGPTPPAEPHCLSPLYYLRHIVNSGP